MLEMMSIYVSHSCWYEKPVLFKRKLNEPCDYIANIQSIHMHGGVTVTPFSPSPLQKCGHVLSLPNHFKLKIIR